MSFLNRNSFLGDVNKNTKVNDKLTKRSLLGAFGVSKYDAFFGNTPGPILPSYPPLPEPPSPEPTPGIGAFSTAFSNAYDGPGSGTTSAFSSAFSNAF